MRIRTVTTGLLLLALGLAVGPAAATDGPLPRLGERGQVTDAPSGLSISPAVLEVAAQPGRRVEVRHLVANATDEPLQLRVHTSEVPVSAAGPSVPAHDAEGRQSEGPARVVTPVDRLLLHPGEGVELISTAEVDVGRSGVFALRATTAGGTEVSALVVVTDETLASSLRTDARPVEGDAAGQGGDTPVAALIELGVDRSAVVDVRIRVHGWTGVLVDRVLADLVVGPHEARVITVDRPVNAPPGRLHVEVVAVDRDGQEARSATVTDVGLTVPVFAVLLLIIAGSTVAAALRRRRVGSAAARPHPDEELAP